MKYKSLFVLALLVAALVNLPASAALKVGDTAPDFTLLDADGNSVSLYDFYGKIIWLNFWQFG